MKVSSKFTIAIIYRVLLLIGVIVFSLKFLNKTVDLANLVPDLCFAFIFVFVVVLLAVSVLMLFAPDHPWYMTHSALAIYEDFGFFEAEAMIYGISIKDFFQGIFFGLFMIPVLMSAIFALTLFIPKIFFKKLDPACPFFWIKMFST